jgi:hypothetical protein
LQRQAGPDKGGRARIKIRRANTKLSASEHSFKDINLHADIATVVKIEIIPPRNGTEKENTYNVCS